MKYHTIAENLRNRGHFDLAVKLIVAKMSYDEAIKFFGLGNQWSKEDLKKTFRKLALEHHPDRGGDPSLMKQLNEAYELLQKVRPRVDTKIREEADMTMVQNTVREALDPEKFSRYFAEQTGKRYQVKDDEQIKKTYYGSSYDRDLEWRSADGETVFSLKIWVSSSDVERVKALGGDSDTLMFKVMVIPQVLHENRKSKMRKRNWNLATNKRGFAVPDSVFPKAAIKRMMKGSDKKRKFSKRDMEIAITKKLGGKVDSSGWAVIPVGNYKLLLYRDVIMRQAGWGVHSVRGDGDTVRSKKFGTAREAEGLIDILHKLQKKSWRSPQELVDDATQAFRDFKS